jgi:uncharacterized membrane protein
MNIMKILLEPYVIIIFISLIITLITYFIIKNNKNNKNNSEENKNNIPLILLYTFIISFLLLIFAKYILSYMNKKKFFQKDSVINTSDRLTIIADDVHIGLIDDFV